MPLMADHILLCKQELSTQNTYIISTVSDIYINCDFIMQSPSKMDRREVSRRYPISASEQSSASPNNFPLVKCSDSASSENSPGGPGHRLRRLGKCSAVNKRRLPAEGRGRLLCVLLSMNS